LLGKNIGLDVKLYYDTGVYGIDAEQQNNNGYALQRRSDRSYITFVDENDSSIRSFANKINHDFVNKHINATSLDNTYPFLKSLVSLSILKSSFEISISLLVIYFLISINFSSSFRDK
jgi:hypothetical protein